MRQCAECHAPFTSNYPHKTTCSPSCSKAHRNRRTREWIRPVDPVTAATCDYCGTRFATTCAHAKVCNTPLCQRRHESNTAQDRRAQRVGLYIEPVDLLRVYEVAHGKCGICDLPVPPIGEGARDAMATVDHIRPLSRGGLHAYANAQLAHHACNSAKGADLEPWLTPGG